jgi:hypothetical protein
LFYEFYEEAPFYSRLPFWDKISELSGHSLNPDVTTNTSTANANSNSNSNLNSNSNSNSNGTNAGTSNGNAGTSTNGVPLNTSNGSHTASSRKPHHNNEHTSSMMSIWQKDPSGTSQNGYALLYATPSDRPNDRPHDFTRYTSHASDFDLQHSWFAVSWYPILSDPLTSPVLR